MAASASSPPTSTPRLAQLLFPAAARGIQFISSPSYSYTSLPCLAERLNLKVFAYLYTNMMSYAGPDTAELVATKVRDYLASLSLSIELLHLCSKMSLLISPLRSMNLTRPSRNMHPEVVLLACCLFFYIPIIVSFSISSFLTATRKF